MKTKDVVIVSGARTAIGEFGGTLKSVKTTELGSLVIKEALNVGFHDPRVTVAHIPHQFLHRRVATAAPSEPMRAVVKKPLKNRL